MEWEQKYEISRLNGNSHTTDKSLYLDPNSPFFNKKYSEQIMSDQDKYAPLIKPLKIGKICKKAKKK